MRVVALIILSVITGNAFSRVIEARDPSALPLEAVSHTEVERSVIEVDHGIKHERLDTDIVTREFNPEKRKLIWPGIDWATWAPSPDCVSTF